MNFSDYIEQRGRGAQQALADSMKVSPVLISQWVGASRQIPIERCVEIEHATEYQVTRRELRPDDWWRIWPELVTKKFPIPAEKAAT